MNNEFAKQGWRRWRLGGTKTEEDSLSNGAKSTSEISKKEQSTSSNEAKPPSEIITEVNDDDDSKHNVTLGDDSLMSACDAAAAKGLQLAIEYNKKQIDDHAEKIESLQSNVTGLRNAVDYNTFQFKGTLMQLLQCQVTFFQVLPLRKL